MPMTSNQKDTVYYFSTLFGNSHLDAGGKKSNLIRRQIWGISNHPAVHIAFHINHLQNERCKMHEVNNYGDPETRTQR